MKYLTKFETQAAYTAAQSSLILPNVSLIAENNKVGYNPLTPTPVLPNNIIKYAAPSKLAETTSNKNSGLHTNQFSGTSGALTIISHTFENGEGTIEFSDDVTIIGGFAFFKASAMTEVELPNSVITINNGESTSSAFYNCYALTSCTIGSGVTSIGNYTFNGCKSLTSINIPSGVTTIGNYAFQSCSGLTSCTIGSVTSISEGAFYYCTSLTSIDIPDSVTSIYNYAFYNCSSLTALTFHSYNAPRLNWSTDNCEIFRNVRKNGILYRPSSSDRKSYLGFIQVGGNVSSLTYYGWTVEPPL